MARAGLLSSLDDDKRRALEVLDAGLAQYPEVLDLRMAASSPTNAIGKGDASVRELRKLLEDRPGDPVVQNALGYTLADQDRQLPEARTLDRGRARTDAGQCRGARQHGLGALPGEAVTRRRSSYLKRAHELGDDAEIACTSAKCSGRWATRPRRARPGRRR